MLRSNWTVLAIFILALFIRLVYVFTLGSEDKFYDSIYDQFIYVDIAHGIATGRGFSTSYDVFVARANTPTAIQPPFYPVLLALTLWIFGNQLLVIRLIQAVVGSLMCVTGFLIGKKVADRSVGLLAACLIAIYPLYVMFTRPILTDLLYAFGISFILLLFAYFVSGTFRFVHFVLWGISIGITFLIRPEVAFYAPLVAPAALFWALKPDTEKRPITVWKAISYTILSGVVCLIIIAPWAARNWQVFGKPLITPTKNWGWWEQNALKYDVDTSAEWVTNCQKEYLECSIPEFASLSELERDAIVGQMGREFIKQHPLVYARYGLGRLHISFPVIPRESLPPPIGYKGVRERIDDGLDSTSLDSVPYYLNPVEKVRVWFLRVLLILSLIGLVFSVRRRNWLALIVLALPVSMHIVASFFLHGGERMRMPADICLILLASYATVTIYRNYSLKEAKS